jgi:hypothetical protein
MASPINPNCTSVRSSISLCDDCAGDLAWATSGWRSSGALAETGPEPVGAAAGRTTDLDVGSKSRYAVQEVFKN